MRVDREAFLVLTACLAQGCQPRQPAPPVASPAPPATVASLPSPPDRAAARDAPFSAPVANTEAERGDGDGGLAGGSCDNNASKGDVSLCNALRAPSGPACEGFSSLVDECRGLGGGPGGLDFKPVIAEAIAACIYKRSGTRALCRRSLARDCVKEAIKNTCIEGAAAKKCDALTAECNALGHKVRFKRSDCESAMSVLTDTGLATWSQNVTGPTREGCTFDYFLPYYPFGKN